MRRIVTYSAASQSNKDATKQVAEAVMADPGGTNCTGSLTQPRGMHKQGGRVMSQYHSACIGNKQRLVGLTSSKDKEL